MPKRKLALLVTIVAVVWPLAAAAGPGDADRTFSRDGRVRTLVAPNYDTGRDVARQSTGKIIVAGWAVRDDKPKLALVRYTRAGEIDRSFGNEGVVVTGFGDHSSGALGGIRVLPNDKILVAGHFSTFGIPDTEADIAVARYKRNGALDTKFNDDGKVLINLAEELHIGDLSVFPNGDVGIVGTFVAPGTNYDLFAARLDRNGEYVSSFNGGYATDDLGSQQGFDAAITQGGKLVAAGFTDSKFLIYRYLNDGSPDPSFGESGGYTVVDIDPGAFDQGLDLLALPNGKLIVVGHTGSSAAAIVRFKADGTRDLSFDDDAIVKTTLGSQSTSAYGVVRQPRGRFAIAGNVGGAENDFFAARYLKSGDLDPSFGKNGTKRIDFGMPLDRAFEAVVQPDGRIVMAGEAGRSSRYHFAAARVRGDVYTKVNVVQRDRLVVKGIQFPALAGREIRLTLSEQKPAGGFDVYDVDSVLLRKRVDVNNDGFKESRFRTTFSRPNATTCKIKARFPGAPGFSSSQAVKTFPC